MREQRAKEYLQTIYTLQTTGTVRAAYLAREMSLSKASVSNALKSLSADGYLTVDKNYAILLTPAGERLAHASIRETVNRGKDYHERFQQMLQQNERAAEAEGQRRTLEILKKERCSAILEALLILSKRYYCVRTIDIAQFLHSSGASVRGKLRHLEHGGYVQTGEESVVSFTEKGRAFAEALYAEHAPQREKLMDGGLSLEQAEQETAAAQRSLDTGNKTV